MTKKEKRFLLLGRAASAISVLMYVSYIAQIASNLSGQKGNLAVGNFNVKICLNASH